MHLDVPSTDSDLVTIDDPDVPAGVWHTITLRAGTRVGFTHLQAKVGDTVVNDNVLEVDVKPFQDKSIRLVTLAPAGLEPHNVPHPDSVAAELNRIYLHQANVHFQVESAPSDSFNYDVDHDYKLHVDKKPGTQLDCYGCLPATDIHGEFKRLRDDAFGSGSNANDNNAWIANHDHLFVWLVKDLSNDQVNGFSEGGKNTSPIVVRTDYSPQRITGFVEITIAHEVGHALGRGGFIDSSSVIGATQSFDSEGHNMIGLPATDRNNRLFIDSVTRSPYLMKPANTDGTPRRLSRQDWNLINFVVQTPISLIDRKK